MPITSDELERLADDIYLDRRITGSMFCGNCGYNLKTLPRSYNCPECGQRYNARPPQMKGIFFPEGLRLPFGAIVLFAACGAMVALLLAGATDPIKQDRLVVAGLFMLCAIGAALWAWNGIARFLRFRSIAKRVTQEEND